MPSSHASDTHGQGSADIRFHFSWTEGGLRILDAPARPESYALPSILQRSLGMEPPRPELQEDRANPEDLIALGSVANSLQRTRWGTLNINFEPGSDRRVRVYLSISDLTFAAASDEIEVVLRRESARLSHDPFVQWRYHTPPLPPATYQLTLRHGGTLLSRVLIELEEPARQG